MTGDKLTLFHDHFSSVSKQYARYRPIYPDELFDWLASVVPGRNLAWDCATGTGQAATGLASRFNSDVATDASPEQIAETVPHPRISYYTASAYSSGLDDGSADLITVAQAMHWFDIDRFFREAERVLGPRGVLAVWTYGPLSVDDELINPLIREFASNTLGLWWPEEWATIDAGKGAIVIPFERIPAPEMRMSVRWTFEELLGHVRTWSAVTRYIRIKTNDPVTSLASPMLQAWGNPACRKTVTWTLLLTAGRNQG
ncbi:MAG: class I SAM-dependent methyltransferase [Chlorobiaceae bacterium]|nr:class I SAM-dependent methyltransferase [Chlorobiaceae bacterium]